MYRTGTSEVMQPRWSHNWQVLQRQRKADKPPISELQKSVAKCNQDEVGLISHTSRAALSPCERGDEGYRYRGPVAAA
jgi:hypothetical protein